MSFLALDRFTEYEQMRAYDGDPNSPYILIRVFNIDGERPGVKFYVNPWTLYMDRVLEFRSDNGYKVFSKEETQDSDVLELSS